ncbi:hypothetical protein LTR36_001963 [Oleoguttula mirabilis]|uniref:histidine kinase n=1 Tax=Oleoguttula mirabilis TaxID=1507867 RepID=A0AAV9JLB2_9PEZI|nr:hypothetical protein LTR36_001963 [Oleoguttula mirabilis]
MPNRVRRGAPSDDGLNFMRPRTEAARERDAFRFLHPWIEANQPAHINRAAFPHNDDPMPEPEGCPDTALAALTQLAALRIGARRTLVTLVATDVEYVLAEATKSMSLQYDVFDDPKDYNWLGTSSFLRAEGVNDLAIYSWRKARRLREVPADKGYWYTDALSPHALIISDVRGHSRCRERPFVRRASWLRFFCSVPLRDLHGSVIGSLTVLDDKPRYGISMNEMAFMEDMADTITEHLEATIVRSQRQRSERLIQGLSLFVNGKGSLRQWWLAQDDARRHRAGRYQVQDVDSGLQNARVDKEFGTQELPDGFPASRRAARRANAESKVIEAGVHSHGNDLWPAAAATRSNSVAAGDRRAAQVAIRDFAARPAGSRSQPDFVGQASTPDERDEDPLSPKPTDGTLGSTPISLSKGTKSLEGPFDLARASDYAYARASNLIREAVGAEGVVFVDANAASTNAKQSRRRARNDTSEVSETTNSASTGQSELSHNSTSEGDVSDTAGRGQRPCKLNGFSTRNRSTLNGSQTSAHHFNLSDADLAALIRRYPRGKIFNFEESGDLYSSSGEDTKSAGSATSTEGGQTRRPHRRQSQDAKQLGKVMIGARTIAFFPIWDDALERWRTCLFVWSNTPLRFFDPVEDITYMSAFSHSLVAELARLETQASDMAKGTFISSISHELRSPLHGVLAGAEFLMESEGLSPFQSQMVSTISMAGRTLLDTVNHILDYGKLSNFSGQQRKDRAAADATRHQAGSVGDPNEMGVMSSVDLARLTEEVVETVVSARRFDRRNHTRRMSADEGVVDGSGTDPETADSKKLHDVSVSVEIDRRDDWMIDISPGSWTRILTNLVGNALKYTQAGTVAVKLTAGEISFDRGAQRGTVTLTIRDSGIGMSTHFLANGLYTPFKQADSHSIGTGLGLSIVKQIAKDIRADLDVVSELGKGTRVALSFKAKFVPGAHSDDVRSPDAKLLRAVRKLGVHHFHLLTLEDDENDDDAQHDGSDNARVVAASVRNMAAQWVQCETSTGPRIPATSGAVVCAMAESDLLWLADERPQQLSSMLEDLATRRALPLILASSVGSISTDLSFDDFPVEPIFLHQAIGPRKLMRSIVTAQAVNASGVTPLASAGQLTPRVFKDYNSGGKRMQGADHHFPWHSSTSTATQGNVAAHQDGDEAIRPQLRPRISRRTTAAAHPGPSLSPTAIDPLPSPAAGIPLLNERVPPIERTTVLLVEDNEINMKLLVAAISKYTDLQYECAGDGLQALNAYTATPAKFLLILMDLTMPVMDGFTCTAKIRELERKRRLPRCMIVALTGVTSSESRESALDVGVDKYFTKPIRMKDISTLVAEMRR